uniref:Uncharacterized protein n=1 Tax=Anguilla anguilla TaxID=7936 RepID=A0A0E9T7Q8_ANGAN
MMIDFVVCFYGNYYYLHFIYRTVLKLICSFSSLK